MSRYKKGDTVFVVLVKKSFEHYLDGGWRYRTFERTEMHETTVVSAGRSYVTTAYKNTQGKPFQFVQTGAEILFSKSGQAALTRDRAAAEDVCTWMNEPSQADA